MQAGDEVRLLGDPGRRGIFTGRETARAGRLYGQIRFPDRTEWVPVDQIEVVPEGGDPAIDLLRRGRTARPSDLYRALAHIRLSGRLVNFIYSLDTTETDFYAYQFKPVLKLLHSVSNGILIADEVGPDRTLLVLCTAFRAKPDRYSNLTAKKIPKAVLSRCEWGKDDYSLRVENLPKAPPKPGQLKMFGEEAK